jgi:signal transduction histidine kinase
VIPVEPLLYSPDQFASMVRQEVEQEKTRIVMIDSIYGYQISMRGQDLVNNLHALCKYLKNMGVTVILINDVLLLGRAESGKMALCLLPLELAKFCKELVSEFQNSLKLKPQNDPVTLIFVNQCQSAIACLEASLLRRILSNLLSNAIKYSPPNTEVVFELKLTETEAVFSVQDAGIGIPLADQERLFDSFFRAKNVGIIPRTGLGLSIVKKCVDLHGGEIALSSEEDVGSKFTVTLPLAKLEEEQLSPATP